MHIVTINHTRTQARATAHLANFLLLLLFTVSSHQTLLAQCPNPLAAGTDGSTTISASSTTPIDLYSLITGEQTTALQINEGFDVVSPLPTGWVQQNLSSPVGPTTWFQGNASVFPAYNGAANSYIRANFNSTTGDNTISNWLFTPVVSITNGAVFTFRTRTVTGPQFPDRLEVRLSTAGTSTDAGASSTSVGDFTTLLTTVNPTLTTSGYPDIWTQYTITIPNMPAIPAGTTGRFAFRYFVTNGGPGGDNSDYMGIDDVTYNAHGSWSRTSGTGGSLDAATGIFTPASGVTTSTFQYEMPGTYPCTSSDFSTATVTVTPVAPPITCPSITGLAISGITDNTATATWDATTAPKYRVTRRVATSGASVWISADVTAPTVSKTFTGLAASTKYGVRVRALCSSTFLGVISAEKTFTTTGGGSGLIGQPDNIPQAIGSSRVTLDAATSVNVYPNPVRNYGYLEVANMPNQAANISISDLNGRIMLSWRTNIQDVKHIEQFDLGDMPSGVYNIQLQCADGTSISRTLLKM